jgi:hypothetical protein
MRTHALVAALAALALAGCALAPEFKTFYLSARDWRGSELSGRGRLTVADAVAGAAPQTITILEIGGLLGLPYDPERRMRLQDERARSLTAALERHGVAPADIGVEVVAADGSEREPAQPLLSKRMVIVVHY